MISLSNLWLTSAMLFNPVQNFFNGNFWQVFEKKFAKFGNDKSVIDLACGIGELRKHINSKKYLGIDLNKSYILHAKNKFKDEKTLFLTGDITKHIFPKNFDTVFLISAAHHLSDSKLQSVGQQIKRHGIKTFIVVDGYPNGLLSGVLSWLDKILAGGKYFRSEKEIARVLSKDLQVEKIGRFKVSGSFYHYPYVILTSK